MDFVQFEKMKRLYTWSGAFLLTAALAFDNFNLYTSFYFFSTFCTPLLAISPYITPKIFNWGLLGNSNMVDNDKLAKNLAFNVLLATAIFKLLGSVALNPSFLAVIAFAAQMFISNRMYGSKEGAGSDFYPVTAVILASILAASLALKLASLSLIPGTFMLIYTVGENLGEKLVRHMQSQEQANDFDVEFALKDDELQALRLGALRPVPSEGYLPQGHVLALTGGDAAAATAREREELEVEPRRRVPIKR